jgi:VIT1/CCC1 family predicted Fe2+/Mn2+ transporter
MSALLALLSVHFVADFVLQSDWMAQNKSQRWDALTAHVAVYTVAFLPVALYWWGNSPTTFQFLVITFALHFLTDAITSRINSRLWAAKRVHAFFVGIGADQLSHAFALALAFQVVTR